MTEYRYSAFVSYSHYNSAWGKWLVRKLETFKTPSHLADMPGTKGPVPARLGRIFRDREELAAGANLSDEIKEALAQSKTLVVLCSPHAAASPWVNQEIEVFRALRGDAYIFPIIVAGEPNAAGRGMDPALECFPEALVAKDRASDASSGAPLAADARPVGDGKKLAFLKIVAGILGVRFDDLARRHLQRRNRRLIALATGTTIGMLIAGALALQARNANIRAEQALELAQENHNKAESLIDFMVDDLFYRLRDTGRLDVLYSTAERLSEYYQNRPPELLTPEEKARKASTLQKLAQVYLARAQNIDAEVVLELALETTSALVAESPDNAEFLMIHIEGLHYLALMNWRGGNFDAAFKYLVTKLEVSKRLQQLMPGERSMLARLGSSYVHVGVLQLQYYARPAEALASFETGLAHRQAAVDAAPAESDEVSFNGLSDLGGGYYHVALAQQILGPMPGALAASERSVAIYKQMLDIAPESANLRFIYYRALSWHADVLMHAGDTAQALALADRTVQGFALLLEDVPDNLHWRQITMTADVLAGTSLLVQGRLAPARQRLEFAVTSLEGHMDEDNVSFDHRPMLITGRVLLAQIALRQNRLADAAQQLDAAQASVERAGPRLFQSTRGRRLQALLRFTQAEMRDALGDRDGALTEWRALIDVFGENQANLHPEVRFHLMMAYQRLGEQENARDIALALTDMGYARADFAAKARPLIESIC